MTDTVLGQRQIVRLWRATTQTDKPDVLLVRFSTHTTDIEGVIATSLPVRVSAEEEEKLADCGCFTRFERVIR